MKILWSAAVMAAAAVLCGAEDPFRVEPGKNWTYRLPGVTTPERLVRIHSRLALDQGEGFGSHALRLKLDGTAVAGRPVNVFSQTVHHVSGRESAPRFDPDGQAWFVKADSDFVPYNGFAGGSRPWNYFNVGEGRGYWNSEYYDLVFEVPASAKELTLENLDPTLPLIGSVETAPKEPGAVFFRTAPGSLVFPFLYPAFTDRGVTGLTASACRGETAIAVLSVKAADRDLAWTCRTEGLPGADLRVLAHSEWTAKRSDYVGPACMAYVFRSASTLKFPDRLAATPEWKIPAGEASSVWVMWRVPDDAPAGVVRGRLTLSEELSFPVEITVLPFRLPEAKRANGIYTNSLPNRDPEYEKRQALDIRSHGIDTIFVDPWTTRIPIDKDGNIDPANLRRTLKFLKEYGFNEKIFIFGILEPVFDQLNTHVRNHLEAKRKAAEDRASKQRKKVEPEASDDITETLDGLAAETENAVGKELEDNRRRATPVRFTEPRWQELALKVFTAIGREIEAGGYQPFFTSYDEPDTNPAGWRNFYDFMMFLKTKTKFRHSANVTPKTYYKYRGTIDFNICNGMDSAGIPAEWFRSHCFAVYRQIRSFDPKGNRLFYGFQAEAAGYRAVWGFSYFWGGGKNWDAANPVREADGRTGTTVGWEMVRAGIWDARYVQLLRELDPGAQNFLNERVPHFWRANVADIAAFRAEIVERILKRLPKQ